MTTVAAMTLLALSLTSTDGAQVPAWFFSPIAVTDPGAPSLPLQLNDDSGASLAFDASPDTPEPYEAVVVLGAELTLPVGPATAGVSVESVYDGAAVSPDVGWLLLRWDL
jgi:hypothetical protein